MWSDLESLVATGHRVTEVAAGRAAVLLLFSRALGSARHCETGTDESMRPWGEAVGAGRAAAGRAHSVLGYQAATTVVREVGTVGCG
jgi:hypothetical protein